MGARPLKAHFEMFAAYNRWANRRLFACAAMMDDEARKTEVGAFFGSLHGTLTHMLVADQIWMRRFTGEGPNPKSLTEVNHPNFEGIRAAREKEDARIVTYIGFLSKLDYDTILHYTPVTRPEPMSQPLHEALAHFFNHQTHHRGQCHQMLRAAGQDAFSLDLVDFQRGWE